jgi:anti-sigma factor ChrR (cupin superfamily)
VNCPRLFDVAPYALGTLDPEERAHVARHLAECRDCQVVLESVAGLPGLLARVGADAVEPHAAHVGLADLAVEPDEAMFERLVARARPETEEAAEPEGPTEPEGPAGAVPLRRRRSGRAPIWRRWAAAGVAAAAVALGTGTWAVQHAQSSVRVVAASAGDVHARAWLRPAGSGTDIRLELGGVDGEQRCSLVTVDRAGHRTVASTWEAGYTNTQTFESTVPLTIDQLASLRVETDQGLLLTMSVE